MLSIFRWSALSNALCVAWLAVASAATAAADVPTKPSAESQVPEVAARQAEARAILMGMADYLARTPHFSVAIQSGYDVLQASGQENRVR